MTRLLHNKITGVFDPAQVGYVSSLEGNMMLFDCSYLITKTARS